MKKPRVSQLVVLVCCLLITVSVFACDSNDCDATKVRQVKRHVSSSANNEHEEKGHEPSFSDHREETYTLFPFAQSIPDENKNLFEGDIVPLPDEIEEDYGKKLKKKLEKSGVLPKHKHKHEHEHEHEHKRGHKGDENELVRVASGGALHTHLWQQRVNDVVQVPYTFEPGAFTAAEQSRIRGHIKNLGDQVKVVEFVQRTTQQDYINVINHYGCYSFVGRVGGKQKLSLASWGCLEIGTVQHEFMHALGFYHEHSRPDRDKYVTINTSNIQPDMINSFAKRKSDVLGVSYDYGSIMHYGKFYFSKNKKETITTKNGAEIGQRKKLSASDVREIRLVYQCKSGPRNFRSYRRQSCSPDCPCWTGLQCTSSDQCRESMVCRYGRCAEYDPRRGKPCKDSLFHCPIKARLGVCKHHTDTRGRCRKSCGLCNVCRNEWSQSTCSAKRGRCRNDAMVRDLCRKTCNNC